MTATVRFLFAPTPGGSAKTTAESFLLRIATTQLASATEPPVRVRVVTVVMTCPLAAKTVATEHVASKSTTSAVRG